MPLIIIVVIELAFTFRFHESIMRLFKPHQHTFPDLSSVFISFIQIFFKLRDRPLETLWGAGVCLGIFEPQEFFFVMKFFV